jgi:hypothetical protein
MIYKENEEENLIVRRDLACLSNDIAMNSLMTFKPRCPPVLALKFGAEDT